jgi:hypothetical protein
LFPHFFHAARQRAIGKEELRQASLAVTADEMLSALRRVESS